MTDWEATSLMQPATAYRLFASDRHLQPVGLRSFLKRPGEKAIVPQTPSDPNSNPRRQRQRGRGDEPRVLSTRWRSMARWPRYSSEVSGRIKIRRSCSPPLPSRCWSEFSTKWFAETPWQWLEFMANRPRRKHAQHFAVFHNPNAGRRQDRNPEKWYPSSEHGNSLADRCVAAKRTNAENYVQDCKARGW